MKALIIAATMLATSTASALETPSEIYQRKCVLDGGKVVIETILHTPEMRKKYPLTHALGEAYIKFGKSIPEQGEYYKDKNQKKWSWGSIKNGTYEFSLLLKGDQLSIKNVTGSCLPSKRIYQLSE